MCDACLVYGILPYFCLVYFRNPSVFPIPFLFPIPSLFPRKQNKELKFKAKEQRGKGKEFSRRGRDEEDEEQDRGDQGDRSPGHQRQTGHQRRVRSQKLRKELNHKKEQILSWTYPIK